MKAVEARKDVGKLLEQTMSLVKKIENKGGVWLRIEGAIRRAHGELTSAFLALDTMDKEGH